MEKRTKFNKEWNRSIFVVALIEAMILEYITSY
jgi:hypothetical protein